MYSEQRQIQLKACVRFQRVEMSSKQLETRGWGSGSEQTYTWSRLICLEDIHHEVGCCCQGDMFIGKKKRKLKAHI
jgi:hypothetical protein